MYLTQSYIFVLLVAVVVFSQIPLICLSVETSERRRSVALPKQLRVGVFISAASGVLTLCLMVRIQACT